MAASTDNKDNVMEAKASARATSASRPRRRAASWT